MVLTPPSTGITAPVMNELALLARNTAMPAIPSGGAGRSKGTDAVDLIATVLQCACHHLGFDPPRRYRIDQYVGSERSCGVPGKHVNRSLTGAVGIGREFLVGHLDAVHAADVDHPRGIAAWCRRGGAQQRQTELG